MTVRSLRKLPGFNFEFQAPPLTDALPRMDVAVLVGFARSGPLHVPVAVESYPHFRDIFGDELSLAWDGRSGSPVQSCLARAVRDFFRNGGQRCWVVRVAGPAQANLFPIPGLVRCQDKAISQAYARARSEGSWSDGLEVSAALLSRVVTIHAAQLNDPPVFELDLASADEVVPGDLLRLTYFKPGYILMVPLGSLLTGPHLLGTSPLQDLPVSQALRGRVKFQGHHPLWFRPAWDQMPTPGEATATFFTSSGPGQAQSAWVAERTDGSPPYPVDWPASANNPTVQIDIAIPFESAPLPGSLVRIDFNGSLPDEGTFWLVVDSVGDSPRSASSASPPGSFPEAGSGSRLTRLKGQGLWQLPGQPSDLPDLPDYAERLTFELWGRQSSENPSRLSDLGFASPQPRFWDDLPTDAQFYAPGEAANLKSAPALWSSAATPRFPLAGGDAPPDEKILPGGDLDQEPLAIEDRPFFLPIAMPAVPEAYLGPEEQDLSSLERDGLAEFGPGLFLDQDMGSTSLEILLDRADYLRYFGPAPRRLKGIHAALEITEATLIAVPDAIQRAWGPRKPEKPPDPIQPEPLPHPEWEACPEIQPTASSSPPSNPDWSSFLPCNLILLSTPVWDLVPLTSSSGTFSLSWSSPPASLVEGKRAAPDTYLLEEATLPGYQDAAELYQGPQTSLTVYGRSPGNYYYRVRAVASMVRLKVALNTNVTDTILVKLGTLGTVAEVNAEAKTVTLIARKGKLNDIKALSYVSTASPDAEPGGAPAETEVATSDWAILTHVVQVEPSSSTIVQDVSDYNSGTLLVIQRALLRMCAARGDLLAVMTLPEHYRKKDVIDYIRILKSPYPPDGSSMALPIQGTEISYGERRAFNYGALYHPWLMEPSSGSQAGFQSNPPDGAACGLIARRAILRGAWVAPANDPLRGPLVLAPEIGKEAWQDLQDIGLNLVRQEPEGFTILNADTLGEDLDLRPINVRRLLMLLRRLALRLGPTFVFEPNDPAFHRQVQRTFQGYLEDLFRRGAFAGATPATSFQVTVGATPEQIEAGQFVVEIKVAPSLPLTFVTIRLVQSVDRSQVTETS